MHGAALTAQVTLPVSRAFCVIVLVAAIVPLIVSSRTAWGGDATRASAATVSPRVTRATIPSVLELFIWRLLRFFRQVRSRCQQRLTLTRTVRFKGDSI